MRGAAARKRLVRSEFRKARKGRTRPVPRPPLRQFPGCYQAQIVSPSDVWQTPQPV
jgi:hypothetical protein